MLSFPLQVAVWYLFYRDEQIAVGSALFTCITTAGHGQLHAIGHTGGNIGVMVSSPYTFLRHGIFRKLAMMVCPDPLQVGQVCVVCI